MAAADSEPFVVAAEEAGSRLDAFLAARLAVPRHEARRLLAAGDVRLDGRPVGAAAKGWRLAAGAKVAAPGFVPRAAQAPRPEPEAPLVVLAEGPGWVALAKPAGTPVHPLTPGEGGTLLNALVARRPEILGVGEGGLRSGVVHRLDVDTSGAVLFATEEAAWQRLRAAFRTHRVTKRYRAVVAGSPPEEGRAALTLALASHRPARVRVVAPGEVGRAGARATRLYTLPSGELSFNFVIICWLTPRCSSSCTTSSSSAGGTIFLLRRKRARSMMSVTATKDAMMSNQIGQPAASTRVNTQRLQEICLNPKAALYLLGRV